MTTISIWSRLLDIISPRACRVCGQRLGITEEVICAACNLHLPRTWFCNDALNNIMARRFWGRIPIEKAAALFYYEAGSEVSNIIHALKYNNHPEIGSMMGRMAAEEFMQSGFFDGIDMIMPVPLEKKRQRQRGYNQSEEIAKGVAEATGLTVCNNAVERTAFSGSQTRKSLRERIENVEGAFRPTGKTDLKGKHILVVDDIVTSGATVCSCVECLMPTDGLKVSVMSLGVVK